MRVGATSPEEVEAIVRAGGRRGDIYRRLRDFVGKYAGQIRERYPQIPRRVSGYNLDELLPEKGFQVARALVGTEGTCVTVLEATLDLVPWPRARTLLVLGYPDIYAAAERVAEIMAHGPIACEAIDQHLIEDIHKKGLHERYLRYLPAGKGFLLVEFGGDTKAEADARARVVLEAVRRDNLAPEGKIYDDPDQEAKLWKVRESGLGATARIPGSPDTWEGWEDSAVAPEKMAGYLRELRQLFQQHGYDGAFYGHFGQGCLHTRINFDLTTAAGIANYRSFMDAATDLVVKYSGSFSGEHGDGQSKAEFLRKMYGAELVHAFREFKAIWDPAGKMNPGKIVDPYRIDENLRLGSDFHPPVADTHFQYPDDNGDFTRATLRCVGVGECRRAEGGTMCPSYRATREEKHSTRGRAHLLFEMMRGKELNGWRDEHVRESLDLCLACKGCKGDCPVNVDVATYKAEFLSHYYEGRLRPRAAYSMGLIPFWARAAAWAPRLANLLAQAPLTGTAAKWLAGIAPERTLPTFAPRTFRQIWQQRMAKRRRADGGALQRPQVMLWPDTFNEHFFPEIALDAAEVLEQEGFEVLVPPAGLCCGRPLYDFGMLDTAKRMIGGVLGALREPIERGIPIVGLEPSCVSVFRDELRNLMPRDEDARRLGEQTFLFSEFLAKRWSRSDNGRPTRPDGDGAPHPAALLHGHCHQKALFGMDDEHRVLSRLGIEAHEVDSGCCGMAGSFGFERGEKYDVSMKVGELKLLPAVRATDADATLIADGFSCREQIQQATGRRALHVAEVAHRALARRGALSPPAIRRLIDRRDPVLGPLTPALVAAAAFGALAIPRARRLGAGALRGLLGAVALGAAALAGLAIAARRRRTSQGQR
jgi:Fe-S oxidoreductase/FAD/FMN-containing dehydrogenase